MCMKTSLVERTPGAGRQANFSSGTASANASNWLDTWCHSPSYPRQIPSGGACASKGRALNNKKSAKRAFLMFLALSFWARRTTEAHSIPMQRMETEEELRRSARCREKACVNVSQGGASGGGNGGRGGLGRPIFRGRRRGRRRDRCSRRGASPVCCGDGGGRWGAFYR